MSDGANEAFTRIYNTPRRKIGIVSALHGFFPQFSLFAVVLSRFWFFHPLLFVFRFFVGFFFVSSSVVPFLLLTFSFSPILSSAFRIPSVKSKKCPKHSERVWSQPSNIVAQARPRNPGQSSPFARTVTVTYFDLDCFSRLCSSLIFLLLSVSLYHFSCVSLLCFHTADRVVNALLAYPVSGLVIFFFPFHPIIPLLLFVLTHLLTSEWRRFLKSVGCCLLHPVSLILIVLSFIFLLLFIFLLSVPTEWRRFSKSFGRCLLDCELCAVASLSSNVLSSSSIKSSKEGGTLSFWVDVLMICLYFLCVAPLPFFPLLLALFRLSLRFSRALFHSFFLFWDTGHLCECFVVVGTCSIFLHLLLSLPLFSHPQSSSCSCALFLSFFLVFVVVGTCNIFEIPAMQLKRAIAKRTLPSYYPKQAYMIMSSIKDITKQVPLPLPPHPLLPWWKKKILIQPPIVSLATTVQLQMNHSHPPHPHSLLVVQVWVLELPLLLRPPLLSHLQVGSDYQNLFDGFEKEHRVKKVMSEKNL